MHHLTHAYQKNSNILTDNAEDLDIVMPMYKMLEHIHNYSVMSESLRNDYRDGSNYFDDNASEGRLFKQ